MPRQLPPASRDERLFCTRRRHMERYDPKAIEAKWQRVWADEQAFHVPNPGPGELADRSKTFIVEMLPYPSGELHMGHVLNYTIGDVVAHLRRRRGLQV